MTWGKPILTRMNFVASISSLALALFLAPLAASPVFATPPAHRLKDPGAWQVAPAALAERAKHDRGKIEEFAFIAQKAREMALTDVWFSGGGAAAYAHYEKRKILAEQGKIPAEAGAFIDNLFQAQFLSQDLDIVVDGTPEQCKQLQAALDAKYPYRSGNKSKWEVRPLKQAMDNKIPLLGNADFLAQNNDSHSVGLLSLYSSKPETERVFRDLRAWEAPQPPFLRDVAEHRLRYFQSVLHGQSFAASRNDNPPLLSAIRFLIKAAQFNLDISSDDFAEIRKIVAGFDPDRISGYSTYVQNWLRHNLRKLASQNSDLARSWDILDELGLRPKLVRLEETGFFAGSADHVANQHVFSREPLRSASDPKALKLTSATLSQIEASLKKKKTTRPHPGRTAAQIGLRDIFHATNSPAAYESLTKASGPGPNAFISRPGIERALYGPGFYVGAWAHVGHPEVKEEYGEHVVRMELAPDAVEGRDFIYTEDPDGFARIALLNRDKARVVSQPETERKFYEGVRANPFHGRDPLYMSLRTYWKSYLELTALAHRFLSKEQLRALREPGQHWNPVLAVAESDEDLTFSLGRQGRPERNATAIYDALKKRLGGGRIWGKKPTPEEKAALQAAEAHLQSIQALKMTGHYHHNFSSKTMQLVGEDIAREHPELGRTGLKRDMKAFWKAYLQLLAAEKSALATLDRSVLPWDGGRSAAAKETLFIREGQVGSKEHVRLVLGNWDQLTQARQRTLTKKLTGAGLFGNLFGKKMLSAEEEAALKAVEASARAMSGLGHRLRLGLIPEDEILEIVRAASAEMAQEAAMGHHDSCLAQVLAILLK